MYYSYPQIQFQEVPNEISLALSISGCDLHCKGCHSKETWNPKFGKELTDDELRRLLKRHKHISCVLFYGGEWILSELEHKIDLIKKEFLHLKICLYTGREIDFFNKEFLKKLNYIKVGPYVQEQGALASKTTNQRFYRLEDGEPAEDMTRYFNDRKI